MKFCNGIAVYDTLREIVDPVHTCLVVWDVQNGLVDRIFNKPEFIRSLRSLLTLARGRMPVFYTRITPLPAMFRSLWSIYAMMRRFQVDDPAHLPAFMAPGSYESEICDELRPETGDVVLLKSTANIFLGTGFAAMLHSRGITTVMFTGIATEIGIESSARDAGNRGFYPVVVADCVSSMDRQLHETSLQCMRKLCIVAGVPAIEAALLPACGPMGADAMGSL